MSEVMDAVEVALADLFRSLYAFPDDDAQSVAAMARERVHPIVEAEASRLQDALSHLEKVNMELSSAVRRYREQAELDIRRYLEENRRYREALEYVLSLPHDAGHSILRAKLKARHALKPVEDKDA